LLDDQVRDAIPCSLDWIVRRGPCERPVDDGDGVFQPLPERHLLTAGAGRGHVTTEMDHRRCPARAGEGREQQGGPCESHPPTHRPPPSSEQGRCRISSSCTGLFVVRVRQTAYFAGVVCAFCCGVCCSIFSSSSASSTDCSSRLRCSST